MRPGVYGAPASNSNCFDPDVITAWKNQGCFEEIEKRLSYRIQLLEANWSASVKPGAILHAVRKLQNSGYAAMYNPRLVYLVVQNASFRYVRLALTHATGKRAQ